MDSPQTFALLFSRLPKVNRTEGLIALTVEPTGGSEAPRKIGVLTDAALRGRLAHVNLHSTNEIALIRQALSKDCGEVTVYESWSRLDGCLQFWIRFVGSQIRPLAWTCESCGTTARESIGGSVGETFLLRCKCGQVSRITVPKR
jgi:hypothetical protein